MTDADVTDDVNEPIKFSGSRRKAIAALVDDPAVDEKSGLATRILAERTGQSVIAASQMVRRLAQDGAVRRVMNEKRTYRIELIEPAPNARYQEVIDEARAARQAAEQAEPDPESTPEPEPEPVAGPTLTATRPAGAVDYDAVAAALLDRVGKVLASDTSHLEATIAQLRADLERVRVDLAEARAASQRLRATNRALTDDNRSKQAQLDRLRAQVRERDDNIAKLTRDHAEIGRRAISDAARREIEATMRAIPAVANGT